jgi:hypothetical protein
LSTDPSIPAPRRLSPVAYRLDLLRRRLALLGQPRATAEASSNLEAEFRARCAVMVEPTVLELGTRRSQEGRSTMHTDWVPHAAEFLGTDMEPGVDVDIVADLHRLTEVTGTERFDVILTCSTFEHIRYPWLASQELMKALKVGGQLYLQTVQSFPLHGYPSDYYRFSREALASLFPAGMNFNVVATNYDFPIRIHSRRDATLQHHPAFLNSTLWGEKTGPTPDEFVYEL